nr:hypothetical protein Iba_chr13eCG3930 [Ipomoea batatas]
MSPASLAAIRPPFPGRWRGAALLESEGRLQGGRRLHVEWSADARWLWSSCGAPTSTYRVSRHQERCMRDDDSSSVTAQTRSATASTALPATSAFSRTLRQECSLLDLYGRDGLPPWADRPESRLVWRSAGRPADEELVEVVPEVFAHPALTCGVSDSSQRPT